MKDLRLGVRIDEQMHAALEAAAAREPDATVADIVRRAIREYLERHGDGKTPER